MDDGDEGSAAEADDACATAPSEEPDADADVRAAPDATAAYECRLLNRANEGSGLLPRRNASGDWNC